MDIRPAATSVLSINPMTLKDYEATMSKTEASGIADKKGKPTTATANAAVLATKGPSSLRVVSNPTGNERCKRESEAPKPNTSPRSELTDIMKVSHDLTELPKPTLRKLSKAKALTGLLEPSVGGATHVGRKEAHALSVRLQDSLAVLEDASKALIQTGRVIASGFREDLAVILEALDELLRAIDRQRRMAYSAWTETATKVRNELQHRNNRVRRRAKEFRRKGEVLALSAYSSVMDNFVRPAHEKMRRHAIRAQERKAMRMKNIERRKRNRKQRIKKRERFQGQVEGVIQGLLRAVF